MLHKTKSLLSCSIHGHGEIYKSIYAIIILGSKRCYENKIRQRKRMKNDEDQAGKDDLAEGTALEQRPELTGQTSNVDVQGQSFSRIGNSWCEGFAAGTCWVRVRNSKVAMWLEKNE